MLSLIFCLLISVAFIFLGWNFQHGKLLFLIAGNNNLEVPKSKQQVLGKFVGYAMYAAGLFSLIMATIVNLNISESSLVKVVCISTLIFFTIEIVIFIFTKKKIK